MATNIIAGSPVILATTPLTSTPNKITGSKTSSVQDKVGHTFGNYKQPTESFGEIVTPDDLRFTYLAGIDLVTSNGQVYTDEQLKFLIDTSIKRWERELDITIEKKRFANKPDEASPVKVLGVDYDEEDDPYDLKMRYWENDGFINLRTRPILTIEKLDFMTITKNVIRNLLGDDWVRLEKRPGQIWLFPTAASGAVGGLFVSGPSGLIAFRDRDYNDAFEIDYTAGFRDSTAVPRDLRYVIGKLAAIDVLNIIGDGLLAGFSSSSLAMDGISESFSSTQSAMYGFFSARITKWLEELETWKANNKFKFSNFPAGSV